MRTAILLAALLGCLAGLGEATVVAVGTGRTAQFLHLAGYAVLADAAIFAIVGGLAGAAWALLCRMRGTSWQPRSMLRVWLPAGFLLIATLLVGSGLRLSGFCPGCGGGHIRAGMLLVNWLRSGNGGPSFNPLHVLAALAVVAGAPVLGFLLARALDRVKYADVGRHPALSLIVATCLVAATALVVQDLSGRGLESASPILAAARRPAEAGSASPAIPPLASARTEQIAPLRSEQALLGSGERAPSSGAVEPVPVDESPIERSRRGRLQAPAQPNVLLITIDTLRADHVGIYGNRRVSSPTMDRLGREGVVFQNAISPQPNTNAAHASLFTGAHSARHGVRAHMIDTLPYQVVAMAERLSSLGYATGGIFSWVSLEAAYSGLERGFGAYENYAINVPSYLASKPLQALAAGYKTIVARLALPGLFDQTLGAARQVEDVLDGKADVTTDAAIRWVYDHGREPFFLWVHYFDPHYPYSPPAPFDTLYAEPCDGCVDGSTQTIDAILSGWQPSEQDVERLIDLYDGEVSFTDQEMGRLMRALDDIGLTERTVIVVTGDHGESFGDHGLWVHGLGLYQSDIRVPLLMRYPFGLAPRSVVQAPVSLVDVMPTVFDLLRAPLPATAEGESLLPLARGDDDGNSRIAVSTLDERDSLLALLWRNWKLIMDTTTWQVELYDLESDPDELNDQASERPEVLARLRGMLDQWKATH